MIKIIVEYGHTFSVRDCYDLYRHNSPVNVFANSSGRVGSIENLARPRKETFIFNLKYPGRGEFRNFSVVLAHISKANEYWDVVLTIGIPFWDSIFEHFKNRRGELWLKIGLNEVPMPVEFNTCCDYMLEQMQNYLWSRPRELVCPHMTEYTEYISRHELSIYTTISHISINIE